MYLVSAATLDHDKVLDCHVCVCGPAVIIVCYHQRPGRHPCSGLAPKAMLLSEGCVELAPCPTPHRNIVGDLALRAQEQEG